MSEFMKFVLKDEGKSAEAKDEVVAPKKTYKSQLKELNKFLDKHQKSDKNQTRNQIKIRRQKIKISVLNIKGLGICKV